MYRLYMTITMLQYKDHDNMTGLEQAVERSKNNMYNNTLDGVSTYIKQQVCDTQMQSTDQHDVDAENCTQVILIILI